MIPILTFKGCVFMNYYLSVLVLCLFLTIAVQLWHSFRKKPTSWFHKLLFFFYCVYLCLLFDSQTAPFSQWSFSFLKSLTDLSSLFRLSPVSLSDSLGTFIWFLPLGVFPVLLYGNCRRFGTFFIYGTILCLLTGIFNLLGPDGFSLYRLLLSLAGTFLGYLLGLFFLRLVPVKTTRTRKKNPDGTELKYVVILLLIFHTCFSSLFSGGLPFFKSAPVSDLTLELAAPEAYVMHLESRTPIYEKESQKQIAPASTTKMLTALTAVDYCSMEEVVTVGEEIGLIPSDSSRAWLSAGNQLTFKQLLVAMLLPSGNDAAYTIAVHTGRKIEQDVSLPIEDAVSSFTEAMNKKARKIGAASSNFVRPDGYDAEGQYTTCEDLAKIAANCLENATLAEIMGTFRISDTWADGREVTYNNTNELLNPESPYYYPNAVGLKTGNSGQAGSCLVSASVIQGETYICVIMGDSSDTRWQDSLSVFHQIELEVS